VPVHPSTRQHLDAHLGQAQFALQVVANFDCLKTTPAHEAVRAALAQVGVARAWVRERLEVERGAIPPADLAYQTVAERRRLVHRRMSRLTP
jgi:hypothetical protein